ncbi:hypothetical protein LPN04_29945 [Rugamonas sp. A1-17]|nr:hypothetical protein [Rugamonas sp. A1-17]
MTIDVHLPELDSQKQMEVYGLLTDIRSSMRRVENEFVFMAIKLGQMQEIVGDQFYGYVQSELGLQKYQVQRMLTSYKALATHLSDDAGRIDLALGGRFTQGALRMFAPVTDGNVVEEVRKLAAAGEKINEAVILRVVAAHETDQEARIALLESEADRARKDLDKVRDQSEVEKLRLQSQIAASTEQMRKMAEQRLAVEEELATLRKQETVVTEKEVPKVPAGYTTIESAIADATLKLEQAQQRERDVARATELLVAQQVALQANVTELQTSTAEFEEIKSLADRFLLQYPQAKIKMIVNANSAQRAAVAGLADVMIEFGTQLRNATSVAA